MKQKQLFITVSIINTPPKNLVWLTMVFILIIK